MSGRDAVRHLSINPFDPSIPVGQELSCPQCGDSVALKEIKNQVIGTFRYWSECGCVIAVCEGRDRRSSESTRHQAHMHGDMLDQRPDIKGFTFDTFDASRITGGDALVRAAKRWIEQIQQHFVAPSYHEDPRAALYFYSKGKGRGKTHLASALVNSVGDYRSVFFADEISFISQAWASELKHRDALLKQPGERAWLTVLDDLGQRASTGPGLQDIWYDVINRRWLKRGWTIITSNYTPEELVERGTINEATYSRLVQMTRGQLITFNGPDQRLANL